MLSALLVVFAGLYLLTLAAAAVLAPERLRRFLNAHASSASTHFVEMGVRLIVGAALVLTAPRMRFPQAFGVFGWLLIGTSLVLCLVPWRLHERFGKRALPLVTDRLVVLALGALAGGLLLLISLYLGPGAA